MHLNDFDYDLPEHFIAQTPIEPRDSAKLMVLDRYSGEVAHRIFREIVDELRPGDVLVMNNTRVIPARLYAVKQPTGARVEILLLRQLDTHHWQALVGGRKIVEGVRLTLQDADVTATVTSVLEGAQRILAFSQPIHEYLSQFGEMPLPPYIHERVDNPERYQTVYSRHEGSAAAPTAGLHFTPDLFMALRERGIQFAYCTLHIGLDTFQPVKVENILEHRIHSEFASLSATDAQIINTAKLGGGRVIAVGTTSARTLETAAILSAGEDPSQPQATDNLCAWRPVTAFEQDTRLFIYPGYQWRVVDGMITNFHLPKSTLMMMISSLAGRESVLNAYEQAKHHNYRFFSFGDAMFIR